jgi:hypothetical protein
VVALNVLPSEPSSITFIRSENMVLFQQK